MEWLNEYKKSLKNIEAEEPLDIYLFRPIAFIVVKSFYSLPITPNQYSLMALISGIISSYYFYQGTEVGFQFGAIFFLLFAILDCCDGMVARLKKNGTEFGRLVDGLVDYAVNIMIYFALAFGVKKNFHGGMIEPWVLVFMAGVSKAIHSMTYDHYLTEYISYESGKAGFAANELESWRKKLQKAIEEKRKLRTIGLRIYVAYTALQAGNEKLVLHFNPTDYCRNNLHLIRLWTVIGPAAHIAFLVTGFVFKMPILYYGFAIIFGNIWLILMFMYQFKVNSKITLAKVQ